MEAKQEYPYVFQGGKYEGETLEWVFLNDPRHLSRIIRNALSKRRHPKNLVTNYLQLAISNLQSKLSHLKSEKPCPICKKEKVFYFLKPDQGKVDDRLVSCQEDSCLKKLELNLPGQVYAINDFLLIIANFKKQEAKSIINIFKTNYPLPSFQ